MNGPNRDWSRAREEVEKSSVSTIIRIAIDDVLRLQNLIPLPDNKVPSDIVEANLVPIRNLAIELDYRGVHPINEIYRFDVFALDREKFNDDNAVAIVRHEHGNRYATILCVLDGLLQVELRDDADEDEIEKDLVVIGVLMSIWYRIQVSLLHPTIKEVFRHSGIMSDKDREESKDYKKRPLYYQKVKTINQREFDEAVKRNIVRKTLIWYVIGHWRNYKDGRRIFIQPYWKGALRETKMTETPRERVI